MQKEKIVFLDIETVPLVYRYEDLDTNARRLWNRKWQHQPQVDPGVQYRKAGIYAEFARVVCVCAGFYNGGRFQVHTFSGHEEANILRQLSRLLETRSGAGSYLCAHNGREFDFPFLCRRMLINRLPLPLLLQLQGLKPWEVKHIDTLDLWKFGDVKSFCSLDLLAHVFGLPSSKDDIDGARVAEVYYEEGDLPRIATYCGKDVLSLARVYGCFTGSAPLKDEDVIFM